MIVQLHWCILELVENRLKVKVILHDKSKWNSNNLSLYLLSPDSLDFYSAESNGNGIRRAH